MADPRRDFVKYTFYKVQPEWRRLPATERDVAKDEFAAVAAEHADRVALNTYSLVGRPPATARFHALGGVPRAGTYQRNGGAAQSDPAGRLSSKRPIPTWP